MATTAINLKTLWAAQSAAEATWWSLAPNSLAAFGTVATLAWAVWLASRQSRMERRQNAATLKAVLAIYGNGVLVVSKLDERMDDSNRAGLARAFLGTDALQRVAGELDRIDLFRLPTSRAVTLLLSAKQTVTSLTQIIEHVALDVAAYPEMKRRLEKALELAQLIGDEAHSQGARHEPTDFTEMAKWLKPDPRRDLAKKRHG